MKRKADSFPSGTLPRSSITRGAAGDRGGGGSPPIGSGQALHGRPEPPGPPAQASALRHMERATSRGSPFQGRIEPRHASPPGTRETLRHHVSGNSPPIAGQRGGSPPGRFSWQARGDPPGTVAWRCDTRGDPPPSTRSLVKHTYELSFGPICPTGVATDKDHSLSRGSTGPPGAKMQGPVNCQSPPGDPSNRRAPPGIRHQARGDPPRTRAGPTLAPRSVRSFVDQNIRTPVRPNPFPGKLEYGIHSVPWKHRSTRIREYRVAQPPSLSDFSKFQQSMN